MLSMQVYNIFVRLCRNKSLGPPSLFQPLYFNNLLRAKYINSYTIDKDAEKFLMNTISIKLMNITFKLLNNLLKNNSNFIKIFFSKENKAKKIISTIVCYVLLLVERDLYCFIIKNKLVFKQLYSGILEFLFNLINIQSTSLFIYDYVYISTISIFETIDESWKKKNSLWKNFICNLSEKLKFTSDNYDTDSQMNNRLDYLSNISKKLESNFEELNSDLSY